MGMITDGQNFYSQRGMVSAEFQWIPGDDEEKFNYHLNLPKARQDLEYNGWIGERCSALTYKMNQFGFRAPEFTDDPAVMFLGCSLTMGVGIEYEKSWAYLVAESLGLRNHNMGIGGSNNDACFRLFNHYHRMFKPKMVIHMIPPINRMEYYDMNGRIIQLMPRSTLVDTYSFWLENDRNAIFNMQKNSLAIKQLCSEQNIPYYCLNCDPTFLVDDGYEFQDKKEYGRDLLHPGATWNRNVAKRVLSLIS